MEKKLDITEQDIDQLRAKFHSAMNNCKEVFGEDLFMDATRDRPKQGMIHYDLLMVTVGLLDEKIVLNNKEKIKNAYDQLCTREDFRRTLSGGLQKKTSILRRRNIWRPLLDGAIN